MRRCAFTMMTALKRSTGSDDGTGLALVADAMSFGPARQMC